MDSFALVGYVKSSKVIGVGVVLRNLRGFFVEKL